MHEIHSLPLRLTDPLEQLGQTPLHLAVMNKKTTAARLLAEHKAGLEVRDQTVRVSSVNHVCEALTDARPNDHWTTARSRRASR